MHVREYDCVLVFYAARIYAGRKLSEGLTGWTGGAIYGRDA